MKQWFRLQVLKWMFTPIRAVKLQKATVRAEGKIVAVHSTWHNNGSLNFGTITVFYTGSGAETLDSFHYDKENRLLWSAERQILEGMTR